MLFRLGSGTDVGLAGRFASKDVNIEHGDHRVDQLPRALVFGREFYRVVRRVVVLVQSPIEIVGLPDVDLPSGSAKEDVSVEHAITSGYEKSRHLEFRQRLSS